MGAMNFRNGYQFDPDNYDDQNAGGLLGMLQAVMQQRQGLPGADYGSAPIGPNSYGGSHNSLFAMRAALQAEQNPYQALARDNGHQPVRSQDPNFRQLVRVPFSARSATDPSNNQLRPSVISYQGGDALADGSAGTRSLYPAQTPQSGGESLGLYGDQSTSSLDGSAPTKVAQIPIPGRGLPLPWPGLTPWPKRRSWPDSESEPETEAIYTPDWLKQLWKLLRKGEESGGGGGEDENDCRKEIQEARKICTDAFANDWKSDYGVGPYRKPSRKPWNIQDCMRGFISERCGGNAVGK